MILWDCYMMDEEIHAAERWQLLQTLYTAVKNLLMARDTNFHKEYKDPICFHHAIEKIFKHGCKIYDQNGEANCWNFIQGLNWLQPSLACSPKVSDSYNDSLPSRIKNHKDLLWLYKSLEEQTLSQKLSWLLSDKEHLLTCLEPWAFLCNEGLAELTLIFLRAVEKNEPLLLADVDLSLYSIKCQKKSDVEQIKVHKRSSSYPVNFDSLKKRDASTDQEKTDSITPFTCNSSQCNSAEYNSLINNSTKSLDSCTNLEYSLKIAKDSFLPVQTTEVSCNEAKDISKKSIELSDVIKVDYLEDKIVPKSKFSDNSVKSKPKTFPKKIFKVPLNSDQETLHSSGSSDTLTCEDSLKTHVKQRLSSPFRKLIQSVNSTTESLKIDSKNSKRRTRSVTNSAPEISRSWSLEVEGQKLRTPKKSFIEAGGSSILPMSTGYFPRPRKGQSLTSFLSSTHFARANAELDRENAHFSICEAMIAAIEQLKCNKQFNLLDETAEESDEEINNLKQRIRIRRRQRQEEKHKRGIWSKELLSDGRTDTTTTDQSISPSSSTPPETTSDSMSTDDVEDLEVNDEINLSHLKNSGLSVSMASLYSEADLFKTPSTQGGDSIFTDSITSAEGVALSLISKFSERHLPRASDLKWLVSEEDAPQRLLPLPKKWPVCSEDSEIDDRSPGIPLRGTIEWAPPRPQIIFTPHPQPIRKILIAKQNYRCAGCGMKVAVEYANRFRYCEYLGRYFCTGCHTNQVTLIPGKILSKWDFNRYPVSNFSYRLLDQMSTDPLFQVCDHNPLLYRRVKQLDRTRILRTQLFFLKDFLFNCRFSAKTQETLKREPAHIICDQHVYSIQDFTQVKTGILPVELSKLVQECCKHVSECVLCQARGFICERCGSQEVIYPWELNKVKRCDDCGTCYHLSCIDTSNFECVKCKRLRDRQKDEKNR